MKNLVVITPPLKKLLVKSPGFEKKLLSTYKLDIAALCGFGCRYCSSNNGYYLRSRRAEFAELTLKQTGEVRYPYSDPQLTFEWPDVIPQLADELKKKPRNWGAGHTMVFSMLTDGFSPNLVNDGRTRAALELVLQHTAFRIRILTKNAVVGTDEWIEFFASHPGRFVVGLSTGTLDDDFARRLELGTSLPSERLQALRRLQEGNVPTYGMLCPIFPMISLYELESLLDGLNPAAVEHIWAEPFNDRNNWQSVRSAYLRDDERYDWFTRVYAEGSAGEWSLYAAMLYQQLRGFARRDKWEDKLRYLLYQDGMNKQDMSLFGDYKGVLFQSKLGDAEHK